MTQWKPESLLPPSQINEKIIFLIEKFAKNFDFLLRNYENFENFTF